MTQYLERPKYEFVEINNKMLLWVRTNSGSFVKEVFFFAFDPFYFHGHQKWGHVAQRARAATDLYRFWWKNLVEALSQQTCIFFSRFSFLYACPTTCKENTLFHLHPAFKICLRLILITVIFFSTTLVLTEWLLWGNPLQNTCTFNTCWACPVLPNGLIG